MARKVHIATPTTLVTMLRTAQYAWQQAALSENARAVFDLGRELYDRLAGMGRHVDKLGRALSSAVIAYNQAVGSLESRVLVRPAGSTSSGWSTPELDPPALVEETTRALSAPELTAEVAAGAGTSAGRGLADTPGLSPSPIRLSSPAPDTVAKLGSRSGETARGPAARMRRPGDDGSRMKGPADDGRRR